MSDQATVRLKLTLDHDELARVLFDADLGPRWPVAKIRAVIQTRIVTWGLAECSRRYKRHVRDAVETGELRLHFQQFAWYRAHVIRAYPVAPPRSRRQRPAAVGRPLLEILADDGEHPPG